jgi:3-oxoacyl-ACP reductase-like protein
LRYINVVACDADNSSRIKPLTASSAEVAAGKRPSMHLKDKIAIVTGAGIGEAISHKFAHNGAKLVLAGLPSDPVQDVAAAVIANGCDNG